MTSNNEESINILKSFLKGTSIVFIGLFLSNFLNFITRISIGRFLGPDSYGILILALAIFGIFSTIAVLGLNSGITRYIAFYKGKKDERRIKGTITSSLKIALPLSFIFSAMILLLSEWISFGVFNEPRLVPMLNIFSLAIPFNVLFILFTASLRGLQKAKYKVYSSDIFYPITKITLVLVLIFAGYGLIGASLGWVLSFIGVAILSGYFLEKSFPIVKSKISSIAVNKTILKFSIPLLFSDMLKLILGWTDIIFLGFLRASFEVGVYDASLTTVNILVVFTTVFAFLFMPVISDMISRKRYKDINIIYKSITTWTLLISFPFFAMMFIYPEQTLTFLFGAEYSSGVLALQILSVGIFFSLFTKMSGTILMAYGKTKHYFLIDATKAVLNVILNILLIPSYGLVGAAIAMTTSLIIGNSAQLILVTKLKKHQPYNKFFFKILLMGLVSAVLIHMMTNFLFEATVSNILFVGILLVLVYSFFVLISKPFSKEDIEILQSFERRTGTNMKIIKKFMKRFIFLGY